MRKLFFLIGFLFSSSCFTQSLDVQLQQLLNDNSSVKFNRGFRTDLRSGTVLLQEGFSNKRTGTKDSDMGEITNGIFLVNYDIGLMAGTRMHEQLKEKCKFYSDTAVNGNRIVIGLQDKNGQPEIVMTVLASYHQKGSRSFPANFWAVVQKEEDMKDIIKIVFSYMPKTP